MSDEIIFFDGRWWRVVRKEKVQWNYEMGSEKQGKGPHYVAVTVEPLDEEHGNGPGPDRQSKAKPRYDRR